MKNNNQKEANEQKSAQKSNGASKSRNRNMRGKQGRKDNKSKRVNFDNERESKFEKQYEKDAGRKGCNDIAWYNQNSVLTKSAGSLPFATIIGKDNKMIDQVPGLMFIHFNPSIGSEPIPYAVNQASNSQYSFLVHANSRNYSQDPADYTLMELAGIEVFAAIADLQRAYGIVVAYTEENSYRPYQLLTGMGFSAQDFISKRGELWFAINEIITRTRQIWIPNTMPYLQRQYWLNSGVYTDAEGDRSQMYTFVRDHYYMLDETGVATGTALKLATYQPNGVTTSDPVEFSRNPFGNPNHYYNVAEFISLINNMLQALIDAQDRGQMYGNILNAYGADKIFALNQIDVTYRVDPVYNMEVLTQIENVKPFTANFPKGFFQDQNGRIMTDWQYAVPAAGTADVGYIPLETAKKIPGTGSFAWNSSGGWPVAFQYQGTLVNADTGIINFHFPGQPTPEQIMIATRLHAGGAYLCKVKGLDDSTPQKKVNDFVANIPKTTGSEIVSGITYYYKQQSSGQYVYLQGFNDQEIEDTIMDPLNIMKLMSFDWHPFIYCVDFAGDATRGPEINSSINTYKNAYGDHDNYAYLDSDELAKLNDVALYSEFGVYSQGV